LKSKKERHYADNSRFAVTAKKTLQEQEQFPHASLPSKTGFAVGKSTATTIFIPYSTPRQTAQVPPLTPKIDFRRKQTFKRENVKKHKKNFFNANISGSNFCNKKVRQADAVRREHM